MIYKIQNEFLDVEIYSWGASILSMKFFDGFNWQETTVRYSDLSLYESDNPYYLNSVIGPHSGRIKDGKYYSGKEWIQLETNDRGNHLHGGSTGFHTLNFTGSIIENTKLLMKAMDEPNKCDIQITFTLEESRLNIDYQVTNYTDLVMNMTHHTYFNLSGEDTIKNHRIKVDADEVCYLDESGAPTYLTDVSGPFDLREWTVLGDVMKDEHEQFKITDNIDHPFKVDDGDVKLESSESKIGVCVSSNRPYVVVYTGNYLLGEAEFLNKGKSLKHQLVAIEPQYLPNDVNLLIGENQLLKKDSLYTQTICYDFYKID